MYENAIILLNISSNVLNLCSHINMSIYNISLFLNSISLNNKYYYIYSYI